MQDLPDFALVPPGKLRERLNDAVLRGTKTATSRLLVMDEMTGTPAEPEGTRMRLIDSRGEGVAVIEMLRTEVIPFGEVGEEVASREGEWLASVADWRAAHARFWASMAEDIRAHLSDDEWELTEETPVVVRFFAHIKEDQ